MGVLQFLFLPLTKKEDRYAKTEVLIIGGGALGTAIARELSRYITKTVLVDDLFLYIYLFGHLFRPFTKLYLVLL